MALRAGRTPNIERRILMTLRFIYFKTSKPQNNPPDKMSEDGFTLLIVFKLTEYIIRCWTFNVRCSMFIFYLIRLCETKIGFFYDQTGRSRPAAGLTPEH